MSALNVIFFGCDSLPGHYNPGHYVKDRQDPRRSYYTQPFKGTNGLDGGLLEEAKIPDVADGRCIVVRRHGWTVIAFWDRSGDSRGASNSAFMVSCDAPAEEILAAAREQWPEIFARPNFPKLSLP